MAGTVYSRTRCPKTGRMTMVNEKAAAEAKKLQKAKEAQAAKEAEAAAKAAAEAAKGDK